MLQKISLVLMIVTASVANYLRFARHRVRHLWTAFGFAVCFLYLCFMETSVFMPILSDYGFKATFGNQTNSLFLRVALQALIKSQTPIREVHFAKNAFEALTINSLN